MQHNFFRFRAATKHAAAEVQSEHCYNFDDFFKKELPTDRDDTCKIVKGNRKRLYDFIQFYGKDYEGWHFAISDKAKKVFEENNITGWSSFPISIAECDKQYHVLCVTSNVGQLLKKDVSLILYGGNEFDIETWDGSDIVNPENTGTTLCTARVKEVIEQNKLTNAKFKPL
jgi:hypothetical protein